MRNFLPWVGEKYEQSGINGHRVLFLGESHYGSSNDEKDPKFTRNIVENWALRRRSAFFTKIAKIVKDIGAYRPISPDEKKDAWHRIAFYNYVQQCLPRPRMAPTPEMWEYAKMPFEQTLSEITPDIVIVLGKRLHPQVEIPKPLTKIYLTHPSSSKFRYEEHAKEIREALGYQSTE